MSKIKPNRHNHPREECAPGRVAAFRDVVQGTTSKATGREEYVRYLQELRRSSAASPVNRDRPRREEKRRAITEQE